MRTTIENLGNGLELVKEFFTNGKVSLEYQMLNGKLHGESLQYDYDKGYLELRCNWVDGELISEIWYNEDGSFAI